MAEQQYQVTIVQYGTRLTEKSDVFLNYRIHHEPDAPFTVDYFFWVINNEERTVVVDTGFSREAGESRGRSFVVEPALAYDALGVDAYGIACTGTASGSPLKKGTVTVGTCSVVTASCESDPTKDCVTVSLDYLYKDHPLLPNFPGVGLLLPSHLTYDATARVS